MNFFTRFFPKKQEQPGQDEIYQFVILKFNYGFKSLDKINELKSRLEAVLKDQNLGDYDEHELLHDNSEGYIYLVGPDARKLFHGIEHELKATPFLEGGGASLIVGQIKSRKDRIEIEL